MSAELDTNTPEQTVEDLAAFLDDPSEQPEKDSRDEEDDELDQSEGASEDEREEDGEQSAKDSLEVEIEDNGQKVKVKQEELIEAYKTRESMQRDYTQKTQALAVTARQQNELNSQTVAFINTFTSDIAAAVSLNGQLQQYNSLNWQQLSQEDPQLYTMRLAELNDLRARAGQAAQNVQQKRGAYEQHQQNLTEQSYVQVWDHMSKADKTFNRDRLVSMIDVAKKYGFSQEEASAISDPRTVHMWSDLHKKAAAYDELVKTKPQVQKRIAEAPTKINRPTSQLPSKQDQLIKRVSKGGSLSVKDFAGLLSIARK
jgi:hypothetical protein